MRCSSLIPTTSTIFHCYTISFSSTAIVQLLSPYLLNYWTLFGSWLFTITISIDNGKTIRETRDSDVPLAARHFYYHAGWAQLMDSEMNGYKPVGVVGQVITVSNCRRWPVVKCCKQVIPWNFPLLMLAWKIAPALAMGNTIVLKPAPSTCLTAILFAEIAAAAGIPAGSSEAMVA